MFSFLFFVLCLTTLPLTPLGGTPASRWICKRLNENNFFYKTLKNNVLTVLRRHELIISNVQNIQWLNLDWCFGVASCFSGFGLIVL